MNSRRLLVWAGIFFALLAWVLVFEEPRVEVEQPAQRGDYEKVFGPERGSVDSVRVTRQGSSVTIGRSGLRWEVTAPPGAEATTEQCESLAAAVADVVVLSVVEADPQDLGQYGLDAPEMVICVNPDDADSRMTLRLGAKAPSDVSIYGLDVERNRVVLVGTYLSFSAGMFIDNIKRLPGK